LQQWFDGGLSFGQYIRAASGAAGTQAPLADCFKSGGCQVATTSGNTTVTGTPAVDTVELTADYGAVGQAVLLQQDDGTWVPIIAASYGSSIITPLFDLAAAPSTGNVVVEMNNIMPYSRPVPAAATLEFMHATRGVYSGTEDLKWTMNGCAMSEPGELTLKYGEIPSLVSTYHVGKSVPGDGVAIADEGSYRGIATPAITNDNFEANFSLGTTSTSGGVTRALRSFKEIVVNFGFKTNGIVCAGGGSYAGLEPTNGYIQTAVKPSITVTGLWDKEFLDKLDGTDSDSTAIQLAQKRSAVITETAWILAAPNCHLSADGPMEVQLAGDDVVLAKLKFEMTCADLSSETNNSEWGAAPWVFAISSNNTTAGA
tara:strand:+ start:2406 stop:3518 length:1113 start_codon:yes stop_codon:yes gene_type:complete